MTTGAGPAQNVEDERGVVGFWGPLGRFTINFTRQGSYDAQCTGVLDGEMPPGFRQQGLAVLFSGRLYRDAHTPPPRHGGEETFWLTLASIRNA
jgi:hypothetical protein